MNKYSPSFVNNKRKRIAYCVEMKDIPQEIEWIIKHINNPIAGFEHLSDDEDKRKSVSKRKQIAATHQQLRIMVADLYHKGKSEIEILSLLKYYMY